MSKQHGISWLNVPGYKPETWNPIVGCTKASPGCDNCYAETCAASARLQQFPRYRDVINAGQWNGRTIMHEPTLDKPLRWKTPRVIFVGSMTDIFHPITPDEWRYRLFAVMALCPQHIFIVLTKRAAGMWGWFESEPSPWRSLQGAIQHHCDVHYALTTAPETFGKAPRVIVSKNWPLPNVWLGVTAENQEMADSHIPSLLETPAAKRFVSCEPMLGPMDLVRVRPWICPSMQQDVLSGIVVGGSGRTHYGRPALDWVICGGESGTNARDMDPDWAGDLLTQCQAAGVPFFMKQMSGNTKAKREAIPAELMVRQWPVEGGAM